MPFGHLLTGNQALMDSEYPKVQTEFFSACEWGTRPPERPRENGKIMTSHLIETYSVHFQTNPFCFIGFPKYVFVKQFFLWGKQCPSPISRIGGMFAIPKLINWWFMALLYPHHTATRHLSAPPSDHGKADSAARACSTPKESVCALDAGKSYLGVHLS